MIDPKVVRRTVLDMLYKSQAGHLGSAMSAVEMLVAMYASVDVDAIKRRDQDRARVIVSKGHCAAAHYAVLHHLGLIGAAELDTYYRGGSKLTGLCSHEVPGVEHSTGSLGHGLAVAAGCAIALRNRKVDAPVLCLLGDAEVQEGSNWEAWLFVKHHNLTNCVALIDDNRIGMIERTEKVLDLNPLAQRFAGLGLEPLTVNGHDVGAVIDGIRDLRGGTRPGVLVCHTVKGKGVPFAEDQPLWHYKTLTEETYQQALEALG